METDTAGNPIQRPSAYCSWCFGPTDTAGRCRNNCEMGVAAVPASSLDTAEQQLAALREENAQLRAKLARCVEALGEIRGRSLAAKTHEVGPLEATGRLTRILELACAALAVAKGGE